MTAKATFDSKEFNSEAFGIYSGLVADLTKNGAHCERGLYAITKKCMLFFQTHPALSHRFRCMGSRWGTRQLRWRNGLFGQNNRNDSRRGCFRSYEKLDGK